MLKITKIDIENFGPYENQSIDFLNGEGTFFVWGNNGSGKTTLHTIVRYALYGDLFENRLKKYTILNTLNIDARNNGEYHFKVTLYMNVDGEKVELVRGYQKSETTMGVPQSKNDFKEIFHITKSGIALSKDQMDDFINKTMNKDISRFFLFDGELLSQYSELYWDNTSSGSQLIRNSIEKILGVPVLTSSEVSLENVMEDYDKEFDNLGKMDKANTDRIQTRETLREAKKKSELDISSLEGEEKDLTDEKNGLEEQMRINEKVLAKINERAIYEKEREIQNDQYEKFKSKIMPNMGDVWKEMLSGRVNEILKSTNNEYEILYSKKTQYLAYEELIQKNICPTCGRPIDVDHMSIAVVEPLSELEKEREKNLYSNKQKLEWILSVQKEIESITASEGDMNEALTKREIADSKIRDINSTLGTYGETEEIAFISKNYSETMIKLNNVTNALIKERKNLCEIADKIDKLSTVISDSAPSEFDAIKKKRRLVSQSLGLIQEAIEVYRQEMKERVEKDASAVFKKMDVENYYGGLKINDNYGLKLILPNGQEMEGRSEGYEHIIAISLICGLHKNAPMNGPIIADSPFGRLDPNKKKELVKTLSEASEQVIFLSYVGEIDDVEVHNILQSKLTAEYLLNRLSATQTSIEKSD